MTDRHQRRARAIARLKVLRRCALIAAIELLVLLVLLIRWGVKSVKASDTGTAVQTVEQAETQATQATQVSQDAQDAQTGEIEQTAETEQAAEASQVTQTVSDKNDDDSLHVITAQDAAALRGDTAEEEATPTPEPTPESYPVIDVFGDTQGYSAVYRVGDTVYELYNYSEDAAVLYTDAVNELAADLKGVSDVYCMIIPTSAGIMAPDALWDDDSVMIGNQEEPYSKFMAKLSDDVVKVPIFDTLMRHRNEYIYFRTDHHWTQLGAYYAYVEFCKAKGIEYHELEEYPVTVFDNFLGTFYDNTGNNSQVGGNPDTVYVYGPISQSATMDIIMPDGTECYGMDVIYDESNAAPGLKYGCFIASDNAFTTITNPEVTDGSSCIIIKESFGNCFAPLLVDHYSTVYVVDYRYWSGSVSEFARENGVDDIIFANNISTLRGTSAVAAIISVM